MSDALPIAPVVIDDMPAEKYHATHALSAGGLKRLRQSPHHFYALQMAENRPTIEPTPGMRAGTLAHCLILEPHAFEERYIVRPDGLDLRTKDGKAWAAAQPAGRVLITAEEHETAKRQAAAVRTLPEVAALLGDGRPEVSAFWIDPQTGVLCKCRPDWVSPAGDGVILLDVKTCQDASPKGFPRTIANFGYDSQCVWYSDGYQLASGKPVLGFVFAAVEADYPHAAAAYMLTDEWIALARERNRELVQVYANCLQAGDWPGYTAAIQPVEMPAWLR